MEEVEECLESESDVLVLLQSSSESRQSTELELSMSEGGGGGISTKLEEFTTVDTFGLQGSLKLTMTSKKKTKRL